MAFTAKDFSQWVLLGEGGEAGVFRAKQLSLDRLVAIKRLKLSGAGQEADAKRFEREAKLCASLNHPSLVQVYDYGREGDFYFLVMEYVDGIDLSRLGDLPLEVRRNISYQIVGAVEFIHSRGVLHRDLKPDNLLVTPSGNVKLLDLGLARTGFHTMAEGRDELRGTLAYFPPEIFQGMTEYGNVSEYYSMALVILEVFTGRRIFSGKTVGEVVARIQSGIDFRGLGLPASLLEVLTPYLRKEPSSRPTDLASLRSVLKPDPGGMAEADAAALASRIRTEHGKWLLSLATRREAAGALDEAFLHLREYVETNPDDSKILERMSTLGEKLNDEPGMQGDPGDSGDLTWARGSGSRLTLPPIGIAFAAILLVLLAAGIYFSFPWTGALTEDLGAELAEKELRVRSQEMDRESAYTLGLEHKPPSSPPSSPYGILNVKGLPRGFKLLLNDASYLSDGEIHLPTNRYFLEIMDEKNHNVFADSITIPPGMPEEFVYDERVKHRDFKK